MNADAAQSLLVCLFRDLQASLARDHARKVLIERLGADAVAVLDKVVQRFRA